MANNLVNNSTCFIRLLSKSKLHTAHALNPRSQFERNHRGPLLGQYSHCPEPKDRVSSPGNDPSGYTTDESGKTDLQTSKYNFQRQVTSILPMPDFTETDNAQL